MTLREIENAIEHLPADELARFRAWFADYSALAWDEQIEQDALSGRLDGMAEAALRAHQERKTTEL